MSDQSAFAGQDNQDLTLIRDCLVDMDQISSKVLRQVMADIADELNKVEEIQQHPFDKVIIHGANMAKPGKVYNPAGAGWRPVIELFELACKAGIDTAVLISPTEEYIIMANRYGVNIIELPHDSNDNYEINLMLDELEKTDGSITIYEAHNFKRVTKDQRMNPPD